MPTFTYILYEELIHRKIVCSKIVRDTIRTCTRTTNRARSSVRYSRKNMEKAILFYKFQFQTSSWYNNMYWDMSQWVHTASLSKSNRSKQNRIYNYSAVQVKKIITWLLKAPWRGGTMQCVIDNILYTYIIFFPNKVFWWRKTIML